MAKAQIPKLRRLIRKLAACNGLHISDCAAIRAIYWNDTLSQAWARKGCITVPGLEELHSTGLPGGHFRLSEFKKDFVVRLNPCRVLVPRGKGWGYTKTCYCSFCTKCAKACGLPLRRWGGKKLPADVLAKWDGYED